MDDFATVYDLVAYLDSLDASDPEEAHMSADAAILSVLPENARAAYLRVADRCDWWCFA